MKKQRALKQPFHYARTCRDIPPEEAKKRVENGESYSVRIKVPLEGTIGFHDMIHGDIQFDVNQYDDFVISEQRYPNL